MKDIIREKFEEWTRQLGPVESRVRIFERIRDIPYCIVPEFYSREKGPAGMLEANKGFCVPKHYLLGMMYRRLDIPVEYFTYPFRWNEQEIDYPPALAKLAGKIPLTRHLACRVLIKGRWVTVDATWDSALKDANFPVNEKWDGESDTLLAVKPVGGGVSEDARGEKEKLRLSRFTDSLNRWLDEVRARGNRECR